MNSTFARRAALRLAASVLLAGATPAWAQTGAYPDHPVRLYVGYPPGGGTDLVARLLAQRLSAELGQQVIVMNLPGATGSLAVDRVAHSAPDGYTLLVVSAADTILPALRAKLPYDLLKDIVPIAPAVTGALGLMVHPGLPVKTVRELIAVAQAQPGKLNFGSPGIGNSQHLAGESFNQLAKTAIVHVPFKGGAEAINAAVGGEIQVIFASLGPAMPLVDAGKLRLLAVTTGSRTAALPSVPTVAEAGVPGYARATWFGLAGPAGLPSDTVQRLNAAVTRAMNSADAKDFLTRQGLEPQPGRQAQFAAFFADEVTQNAKLIRDIGIKPE